MPSNVPAKPKNARRSPPPAPTPRSDEAPRASGQPAERAAGAKYQTSPRSYCFQRSLTAGVIEVLNENLYVMAEYHERTGSVRWRRVVLASERDQIEHRLKDHYPPRNQ